MYIIKNSKKFDGYSIEIWRTDRKRKWTSNIKFLFQLVIFKILIKIPEYSIQIYKYVH